MSILRKLNKSGLARGRDFGADQKHCRLLGRECINAQSNNERINIIMIMSFVKFFNQGNIPTCTYMYHPSDYLAS